MPLENSCRRLGKWIVSYVDHVGFDLLVDMDARLGTAMLLL